MKEEEIMMTITNISNGNTTTVQANTYDEALRELASEGITFDPHDIVVDEAVEPSFVFDIYDKYGFVITKHQLFICPACGHYLNAGPCFQPKRCAECGQRLDFSEVEYIPDEKLGYNQQGLEEMVAIEDRIYGRVK